VVVGVGVGVGLHALCLRSRMSLCPIPSFCPIPLAIPIPTPTPGPSPCLVLEVEDELRAVVDPLALGVHHALPLAGRVVEEARGHLRRGVRGMRVRGVVVKGGERWWRWGGWG
jgi:hypothetical protein